MIGDVEIEAYRRLKGVKHITKLVAYDTVGIKPTQAWLKKHVAGSHRMIEDTFNAGKKVVIKALLLENGGLPLSKFNFTEADMLTMMKQLVPTLAEMHTRGVMYVDISEYNILYREVGGKDMYTITDMGIVQFADGPRYTQAGSFPYMSDSNERGLRDYTYRDDMYALAYLAWNMLEGVPWCNLSSTAAISKAKREKEPKARWLRHFLREVPNYIRPGDAKKLIKTLSVR